MDVIKNQWKNVVRYQFWILSILVLVAAASVFYLTSSSLSALITARTAKLTSTFEQVNTISSAVPTHPNTYSHAQMDKVVSMLEADIQEAWRLQFKNQIPLMVWPRNAFNENSTHEIFTTLRPVEKYIDFPLPARLPAPYDRITLNDRKVYKEYIGPEFRAISKKIGSEWKANLGGASTSAFGSGTDSTMAGMDGGAYPGVGNTAITNQSADLVRWSVTSQQTLLQQVVPWYSMPAPSILDIYYTQEDMWLLTGIMEIIKKANGDARENHEAVVREVEYIRMGRHASRNAGVLTPLPSAAGTGTGYGSGMGMDSMDGGMGMGMASSGGSSGGKGMDMMGGGGESVGVADASSGMDPADGRYISFAAESEFQPRKGTELREAIRTISPSNAVDAVAKRVAVRIRLKIDPAGISRLIAACGSAELMLEVYQVRLNTDPAPDISMGGGGGGYGGSGFGGADMPGYGGGGGKSGMGLSGGSGGPGSMSGGMGGMSEDGYGPGSSSGGGGYGGGYGGAAGQVAAVQDAPAEVSVEIFGLIYLYNPANIVTLGTDLIAEKSDQVPATSAAPSPSKTDSASPAPLTAPGVVPGAPSTPIEPNTSTPVEPNTSTPVEPNNRVPAVSELPANTGEKTPIPSADGN